MRKVVTLFLLMWLWKCVIDDDNFREVLTITTMTTTMTMMIMMMIMMVTIITIMMMMTMIDSFTLINEQGVTSKEGFHALIPSGAILISKILVSSADGRSSTWISAPLVW